MKVAVLTTAEAAFPAPAAVPGRTSPCALVIFGASGDLTARKLLPALGRLAADGALAPEVALMGVARTAMTDDEFRSRCRQAMQASGPGVDQLITGARYVAGGYDDPAMYTALEQLVTELDQHHGTDGNRVHYLATPSRLFGPIAVRLGAAGLDKPSAGGFARLVIEKPFGWDEQSARELYAEISSVFAEEQVFRIDHYLAKETVQNLLAVRFANAIFEPIWNRTWVDNVQITVAESIGVEDRGGFYETAGAMRDVVQNHVLQVLSLFLMEPPTSFHPEAIHDEKLKLLRAIRPFADEQDITRRAIRGQYARGGTREDPSRGIARNRAWTRSHRSKRSSRCAWTSTIGARPASRSMCAPANGCRARALQLRNAYSLRISRPKSRLRSARQRRQRHTTGSG
jgi:glucose-6-phosphate 1-dehydrogenase